MDSKFSMYCGNGILAGTIIGVVHELQKGKPLHPRFVSYLERAKEYVSEAAEEKGRMERKEFSLRDVTRAGLFPEYGLILDITGELARTDKLKKYGIENVDKVIQMTDEYLDKLRQDRANENELQWLDDFFSAMNRFCMRQLGRPLERGQSDRSEGYRALAA